MSAIVTGRPVRIESGDEQFVLPAIPVGITPALAEMIAEYRAGFVAVSENEQPRWAAAAQQISDVEPASLADLVAKLIVAIHYRDPEGADGDLAIEAPEPAADRLAVEMELGCLDWLLERVGAPAASQADWDAAERDYSKADADLKALPVPYTNEAVDRLVDIRSDAINDILDLPAVTVAQALRKIELAMFDSTTVLGGVDFPGLLADARRLAAEGR